MSSEIKFKITIPEDAAIKFIQSQNNANTSPITSNSYLSTITSPTDSSKKAKDFFSCLFTPFVKLWNFIFQYFSLSSLQAPSIPTIDQVVITSDQSYLFHLKNSIHSKGQQSFNNCYDHLSAEGKKLLQNIYYQWVIEHTSDTPHLNMESYIQRAPFNSALADSCDKAISNLTKLSKLKSFTATASFLGTDLRENESLANTQNHQREQWAQFNILPNDLKEEIKYTIWKVLNPQNNADLDFGGTVLQNHITDPFIRDILIAIVNGLKKTDQHKQWYLEMPQGWEKRMRFSLIPSTSLAQAGQIPNASSTDDLATQHAHLTQVMNETLSHLRAGYYISPNGTKHTLDLRDAATRTQILKSAGARDQRPGNQITRISVKNKDCLYAASELRDKGLNPLVLDMASNGHFGGGYLTGARAQEEDCCRRSGLSFAADKKQGLQKHNFYPLSKHSNSAGLYVPNVPIFRAGRDKGYQYLDHPFNVAFGVFAAFNTPPIDNASGRPRLRDKEAAITREKISTFLEMARLNGHDSVILGALGCGAFHNPPDHIAEMTMDVINTQFKHCFKEIVIAVLDNHNTGTTLNPQGNFVPFARQAMAIGGKAYNRNDQEIMSL